MNSKNLTNILESVTPFNMRLGSSLGTLFFPFLAGEEFFQVRAIGQTLPAGNLISRNLFRSRSSSKMSDRALPREVS
jgi:hypothetical protein